MQKAPLALAPSPSLLTLPPQLPTASLSYSQQHHHNTFKTPSQTTMAPTNHFQQAFSLLHALVCIITLFYHQARVLIAILLPSSELHPRSRQTPRLSQAQAQVKILFRLHTMLRLLMSKLLHRCQHGSPAPSPLTTDRSTRHRVLEHNTW